MTLLYQIHSKLFVPPLGRFSPLFNLSSREPENQRKFKFKTKLKIQSYTKHFAQKGKIQKVRSPTGYVLGAAAKFRRPKDFLGWPAAVLLLGNSLS